MLQKAARYGVRRCGCRMYGFGACFHILSFIVEGISRGNTDLLHFMMGGGLCHVKSIDIVLAGKKCGICHLGVELPGA